MLFSSIDALLKLSKTKASTVKYNNGPKLNYLLHGTICKRGRVVVADMNLFSYLNLRVVSLRKKVPFFSGQSTKVFNHPPPPHLVVKRTATNFNKNIKKTISLSVHCPLKKKNFFLRLPLLTP